MEEPIGENIKTKDDALLLIIEIGYDYDSFNPTIESLKELVDELVGIAKIGLKRP